MKYFHFRQPRGSVSEVDSARDSREARVADDLHELPDCLLGVQVLDEGLGVVVADQLLQGEGVQPHRVIPDNENNLQCLDIIKIYFNYICLRSRPGNPYVVCHLVRQLVSRNIEISQIITW